MPEIDFHIPKFELPIDLKTADLESLLGPGEKVSSRDFQANLLERHAPQFTLPTWDMKESDWANASYRTFIAPDVAYSLVLTLSYRLDITSEQSIPRDKALKVIDSMKRSNMVPWVKGHLYLVNPGSAIESDTFYQQPLGELPSKDLRYNLGDYCHAAGLIVESLIRGVGIAEAGRIDRTLLGFYIDANFSVINDLGGLVVAVRNPTAERVMAAVPEFQAFGRYLSEHQKELRGVIDVLVEASNARFDESRPVRPVDVPRIYAAAQPLLDRIKRPTLDGKPILNVLAVPYKSA